MKNLILPALLLLGATVNAQTPQKLFKTLNKSAVVAQPKHSAVIKGNIKNYTDKTWEMCVTGDFSNYTISVPVDATGNFSKTFSLDSETEDVYLYLNENTITLCAQKNDTLIVYWDNNDFKNTFHVFSPNPYTNMRLQTMIAIDNLYRKESDDLPSSLYDSKMSDPEKFAKVNDLYNREMNTATSNFNAPGTQKLIVDVYFKYANVLSGCGLLYKYDLYMKDTAGVGKIINQQYAPGAFRIESEFAFDNSFTYRQFLFDYIRFSKEMRGAIMPESDWKNKVLPFKPLWNEYYLMQVNLSLTRLRDWCVTKEIRFGFEEYSFDDALDVYRDFIPKIKTSRYADTLKQFYAAIKQLRPGNAAPDFNLKNDKGETVSLKSLRGKVVYIDFWGVNCGPCLYEIQNTTAVLHDKYKGKNVVFLNICVDADEKTWKTNLASLKVSGLNLIAQGWNKNPVCQKYNITGIPHYVTINADGKIVNNNSQRPSAGRLLTDELDKALGK